MSVDFELNALEKDLLEAISMKRLERIDACLEQGAGLHFIAGYFEERPLHLAAQSGCPYVIDLLVARGARIDVTDQQGQTPLFHAADKSMPDAVEKLLALKADPNHVAHTGRTAIFSAAQRGDARVIELLIANGADPNFTVNGSTPLFWAVNGSHFAAAKALVAGGARVDARNTEGLTAGQIAQQRGSDFERDRLLTQFLNAAHLEGTATSGTERTVTVLKPLSFRPGK
jgi:ankyrin repeat protein